MIAMTSLERFRAVMNGLVPDRAPVIPVLHIAATDLIQASIGEYSRSSQTMAKTLAAAYGHYGLDGVQLSLGVATEASGMGCKIVEPTDSLPKVVQSAISTPGDLSKMDIPDPWSDGLMPRFLDGLGKTLELIGDEACVMAVIRGPMNIASQVRGIQDLMFDLVDRPGFAGELLDFCSQAALALGRAVIEMGAHVVVIGEAICSPSFISPGYYRAFVQEHHAELCQALKLAGSAKGAAVCMHICGDIRAILPDIVATGADIIDVDWQVGIAEARALAGQETVLRGNIDPVAALHDGTPEEVAWLSAQALRDASPGSRFILSSGCDIPPGTPHENIAALVRTAEAHSWPRR